MEKQDIIYKTALLLVEYFDLRKGQDIHSRIFSYILHPEQDFIVIGQSRDVFNGAKKYPEHAVPCATIISESYRLIKKGVAKEKIANLITKHWKIVYISKEEATYLDTKKGLNLKSKMPDNWDFETGNTFARLELANIEILPFSK